MRKFKRRSFGSGQRLEQHPEDAPLLDLSKDTVENMRELLSEITRKEHISTSKRMGYLNNFSKFVQSVPPTANFGLTSNEVAACLRVSLINPAKEVRAASFRAFRYLLNDEDSLSVFLNQRIDIFIIRSLDLPPAAEVERVQALRLVRKMVYLCPHLFPMSLAMVLSSISCNASQEKDCMSRACLATLCELAVQNIEIGSYSGVIGAIISTTLDCSIPRMNEALISTILYLFNHPKHRCFVRRMVGLEAILAPFTDLYYMYTSDLPDNLIEEDRLNRMESTKLALVAILKSWPGLINFCDPDSNSLKSLLGVFRLPNSEIRKTIIDTLYDVFCLRRPKDTDDFMLALQSVDPSSMQDNWKLTESFLLAEANAVLPHRAKSTRVNLIESYVSLILYAFFEAGILEHLVQVITTSDDIICIQGSILLGELLHMANLLLPPSFSSHTHCLPTLMSLATNLDKTPMERGKASAAAGYLDQLHQMKKRGAVPSSLFMEQLISQGSSDQGKGKSKGRQDKVDVQFTLRDSDELLAAIRETQLMSTTEKEYIVWNWDLISTILESQKMSIRRPDEPNSCRFIKKLVSFYKPSSKLYCSIKQSDPLARKYSEVALQLTDFLLQKEEQPEGEQLLIEILQEISVRLGEASQSGVLSSGIFSTHSLSDTLSRDYFLIIGRLSSSQVGLRILDKTPGIFQYLMEICSMSSRDSLIKVIISCFDYGKDGIARILLSKALTSAPLSARLYATKFMRVLLRIKSPYFSNWGIEFLTNQLYDCENDVVETTIKILEEACEDEANLQRLIEVKPSLLHLGEKGIRLLSRYVSVTHGFSYLEDLDYLFPLLEAWKTSYNREYVNWIELEIMESFTSYDRSCSDGAYINRSSSVIYEAKYVYVLPHLYGELARHRFGIQLIQEQCLLSDAIQIVLQESIDSLFEIFQLKAALWTIGHIASTVLGINLILSSHRKSQLSQTTDPFQDEASDGSADCNGTKSNDEEYEDEEPDIIARIVDMAYNCEVLTIRGTCFFILGLMACTSTGADRLEELGWECVRHKGSDIWPVIEHDIPPIFWDTEPSEEEQESGDDGDVADDNEFDEPADERFGGVYLGDDLAEDEYSVTYTIHTYGKGGNGKGDDITTMLNGNQWPDEAPKSNIKMKYFDVDQAGVMYEKPPERSLISELERLNSHENANRYPSDGYGILYLGDGDSFSDNKSMNYMSQSMKEIRCFEECLPFISGKNPNLQPSPVMEEKLRGPVKELFDEAGIYLGLEELPDDTIEANMSSIASSPTPPHPYYLSENRAYSIENNEPLKPIREEKSQESIDIKNNELIGLSVVKEITVEVKNKRNFERSLVENECGSLDNSGQKDNQQSNLTPIIIHDNDNERFRSISFTEVVGRKFENTSNSPRSLSFSGTPLHNKLAIRTQNHPRSDSDPGAITNSLASSISSQESDILRSTHIPNINKSLHIKMSNRKKSRSENEDSASDRDRSNSVISDNSSQGVSRLRMGKRNRGNSLLSLGVSPKSFQHFPSMPSDSPSSYSREGYGYTTWQSLRKHRSFKKEMDLIRGGGSMADRKRFSKNLGYQYRRLLDTHRKGSSNLYSNTHARRHIHGISTSSSGTTDIMTNDIHVSTPEIYVGRCLPGSLNDFFKIKPYTYAGSWADNFIDYSEILQSLNDDYHHLKMRCLACGSKLMLKNANRSSDYTNSENVEKDIGEEEEKENSLPQHTKSIFREVLRLVCNLSTSMGSKSTQQEMLNIRGRYPWAFQDLCLYSQVMEILGTFSYRLSIRRFIQALFEGVDYTLIFDTADQILGRTYVAT